MNTDTFFRFRLTAVVCWGYVFGQSAGLSPQPRPRFEAASLKLSRSSHGGCKVTPFRLKCAGYGLDAMILAAYMQRPYLVQGLPSWANSAFYDIDGVLERQGSSAIEKPENHRLLMTALQGLLEERFHLKFHHQNQLRPGFRLVAAKRGLKLKSAANPAGPSLYLSRVIGGRRVLEYRNYTVAHLAAMLSRDLERPVVDATGADGHYDFEIQLEPDEHHTNSSVLDALGDFGLKLEAGKLETDIFVIDRLERPADN